MLSKQEKPTAQELVRRKYPSAFVEDTGDWVYIRLRETITEKCSRCGQDWTHEVVVPLRYLGSGGSEGAAWKDALKRLALS